MYTLKLLTRSCDSVMDLRKTLTVIMSEIPCTPWRRTASARRKASWRAVCSSAMSNKRSLGITIRVSTFFCNFSMASNACKISKCKNITIWNLERIDTDARVYAWYSFYVQILAMTRACHPSCTLTPTHLGHPKVKQEKCQQATPPNPI